VIPRRARLWHLPPVARILWAATRDATPPVRSRVTDLALLARLIRRGQVRLMPGPRGPRGFIARDGARIHALYTHPEARGQGIGSRLVAEAQATSPRLELWTGQANARARQFYARHGFYSARLGRGLGNDEQAPDVHMIWQRNAP
jgi:GNAT superfamily N-acetyltransferase